METVLMYAIQNNDIEQVKEVFPTCDISHTVTKIGIMVCILKKYNDILEYLLLQGIDPNIFWREQIFAIHEAVNSDNCGALEILLNYGADINVEDKNGNTAFILAIRMQKYDMVKILKRSNHGHINNIGYAGIHYAISQFDIEMINLLLEMDRESNIKININPLLIAAYYGCDKGIKSLIEKGADLSSEIEGKTALQWAICNGRIGCVQILEKYKY